MKTISLLMTFLLAQYAFAQTYKDGYVFLGMHGAFPQHTLKNTGYDDGLGIHFGFMSEPFNASGWKTGNPFSASEVKKPNTLHCGLFIDYSWMDQRRFTVDLNTPVPDKGKLDVENSSASIYLLIRQHLAMGKHALYGDLMLGGRNYFTYQTVTSQNPKLNPEYEASTTYPRVVYTSKPQMGVGAGALFHLKGYLYTDLGFAYCAGTKGLVQPLKDLVQNGNEINYHPVKVNTDILLIKCALIYAFGSSKSYSGSTPDPEPTNKRRLRKESEEVRPSNTGPQSPKKSLEVKPNTPAPKKN